MKRTGLVISLVLVVGLMGAIGVGVLANLRDDFERTENDRKIEEYGALRDELLSDPTVTEALALAEATCPAQSDTYLWVCGHLIRLPVPMASDTCTNTRTPYFLGSLGLRGEDPFFSQSVSVMMDLPLEPATRCMAAPSEDPWRCAQLTMSYAEPDALWGYPPAAPPDPLPEDLPPPPWTDTGHTLTPEAFATLDGNTVSFNYRKWIGEKPGRPPDACELRTRRGDLRLTIELKVPCAKMDTWQAHLRAAIALVDGGVLASDPAAGPAKAT